MVLAGILVDGLKRHAPLYPRATLTLYREGVADDLDLRRGAVVVCVLCGPGEAGRRAPALEHLGAVTPAEIPVVVVAEPDAVAIIRRLTPADLALVTVDCRPPAGWLDRLRAAAYSTDIAGAAAALTATRIRSLTEDGDGDAVISPVHPRMQVVDGECLYVRRTALELVDLSMFGGLPRHAIECLSAEILSAGMVNVLADDLVVELADRSGAQVDDADEALAALRRLDWCDETSPARGAARVAAVARRGLTVTIDGRALSAGISGTQRYTLELIGALDRFTDVSVRVVLPPDPAAETRLALAAHPAVQTVDYQTVIDGVARTDVVHRPHQVFSPADLELLSLAGERLVVTHQDLIAFHNPSYHADPDVWAAHRRITRLALAAADRVVFFSDAARDDAIAEQLVGPNRTEVVGIALQAPFPEPPVAPARIDPQARYLLCLGSDFHHKNRPFAIRMLRELRARHGWPGQLVLAGAHVEFGSSQAEEQALLAGDPELAQSVLDLGRVEEAQRVWLVRHARAVIVPSVIEGFGMMPLEAAAAGVPCLFAARSSLREVVSESLATLVAWDAQASAEGAAPLLADGVARDDHVRRLRADAARWRWETLAPQLVHAYESALHTPYRAARARVWQDLERERRLAEVAGVHDELLAHLRGRAALARDDGFFTDAQLRGLWRVGSRPALARAAMWPFGLLGDLGHR
jgi:glycosyltransferase involved in cell wall biosynthesis